MALTGTLSDFGIAEILQLIGTQKKTGSLTLEDGKLRAQIEFADGMVVGANGGEETVAFGERLVRSKILSQEEIDEANKRAEATLKSLASVVVSEGYLESDVVRKILTRHISEIVYEVFDWKSGTYAFEQQFLQWDKQLIVPIPAESIMMEGLRIVDEGPGVRNLLPSLDEVCYKAEKSSDELEQLDPEVRQLYELADGNLTLKDIILISDQDKFDAMKHLAWMRMNRFIIRDKEKSENGVTGSTKPQRINTATLIALYILLAVTLAALTFKLVQSIQIFAVPLSNYEQSGSPAQKMFEQARLSRVRTALEVYRLRHGSYPMALDALLTDSLIQRSDIKPFAGKQTEYEPVDAGKGYLLGEEAKTARAIRESKK